MYLTFLVPLCLQFVLLDGNLLSRTVVQTTTHPRREHFYNKEIDRRQIRSEEFRIFIYDVYPSRKELTIKGSIRKFYYVEEHIGVPRFEDPICVVNVPTAIVTSGINHHYKGGDEIRLLFQCIAVNDTCCGTRCCYLEYSSYEVVGYIPLGFIGFIGLVFVVVILFSCWKCRARRVQRMEGKRRGSRIYRSGQSVRRSVSTSSDPKRKAASSRKSSAVIRSSSSTSVIFNMGLTPVHSPQINRRSFRRS